MKRFLTLIAFFLALFCQKLMAQNVGSAPNFTNASASFLTSTNGNWVHWAPQYPDDINRLETKLFRLPTRGHGVMGVEFALRGGDGGKAHYAYLADDQTGKGGQGATLQFKIALDNYYGSLFFVTYGKHGQSNNSTNSTACAGGGGGATGIGILEPGAGSSTYLKRSNFARVWAVAPGGGGGYARIATHSNGKGGGITGNSTNASETASLFSACAQGAAQVTVYSGNSFMPGTAAASSSYVYQSQAHPVYQFSTDASGTYLYDAQIGYGGGTAYSLVVNPLQTNNIFSLCAVFGEGVHGGDGGSGLSGGGAGSGTPSVSDITSLSTNAGGGGGGNAGSTAFQVHGEQGAFGGGYWVSSFLSDVHYFDGSEIDNPQSGFIEYRTIADTVPPHASVKSATVYLVSSFFNSGGSVTVKGSTLDNGSTDNDAIKEIILSDSVFTCAHIGSPVPVIATVYDYAGNSDTAHILITVIDTSAPYSMLLSLPKNVDVTSGPYTVTLNDFPQVSDNCGVASVTLPPTTLGCAEVGTTVAVALTATDVHGNVGHIYQQFNVTSSAEAFATLYVDSSATGANNGTTWADAFINLQDALNAGCAGNKTFYIAKGTYYPDKGSYATLNDRNATFTMREDYKVYGGFPSGGSAFGDRDASAYPVVLSGAIGTGAATDNSYHVVTVPSTAKNVILDGLTVGDGYANQGLSGGGGVQITSSVTPGPVNRLSVHKCNFLNNYGAYGGAISYNNPSLSGLLSFENCIFRDNTVTGDGGAVYVGGHGAFTTTAAFTNCEFSNNNAGNGGALACAGLTLNMVNCSIAKNHANSSGGGLRLNDGLVNIGNTIIYENTASQNPQISIGTTTPIYRHCDVAGSGGSSSWNTSFGTDGGGNIDADPLFQYSQSAYLGIHLTSPCVDQGDNALNSTPYDIADVPRIISGTIDIGAYEARGIVYVDRAAPAGGDGASWATAYNDLQSGLDDVVASFFSAAGLKQIWVKKGTYYPSKQLTTARTETFNITGPYVIYGGFAGNETQLSQRNISGNPTILSGDIGVSNQDNDNACHVVTIKGENPVLDGFIIEKGNANLLQDQDAMGGGLINISVASWIPASATIRNCVFRNNQALSGGAVANYADHQNGTARFEQCAFYNNVARDFGGAIFNSGSGVSSIQAQCFLTQCTGTNNRTTGGGSLGGFMYNQSDLNQAGVHGYFYNSLLWDNYVQSNVLRALDSTGSNNGFQSFNSNLQVIDPLFVNQNNPAGTDGIIMTADDGLRLQPTSPMTNAGDTAYLSSTYPRDLQGNSRIMQGAVDIGAYENFGCMFTNVIYVDSSKAADGNGDSWATAFRYLSDALSATALCPVDTIYIAKGTYYPSGNKGLSATRDTAFSIQNPVVVLGGYPSGGGTRNVNSNPVILDGNINSTAGSDNAYHIMLIKASESVPTVLDGLMFNNANANGNGSYIFNGQAFGQNSGGAIVAYRTLLTIRNCTFTNNTASGIGGGINATGGSLSMLYNTFAHNNSGGGGAVRISPIGVQQHYIEGNTFYKNTATTGGGAFALLMAPSSSATFYNNQFIQNSTVGNGGAILLSDGTVSIINNTFYADSATGNGGALNVLMATAATLGNNLFYKNDAVGTTDDYTSGTAVTQINNSFGTNPLFKDEVSLQGADNLWGTIDDGLNLKPTSSLINQGSNALAPALDITAATRNQLGAVDLGAFESNIQVTRRYVSQAQDSLPADGATWATAFPHFEDGVDAAKDGDTVFVATGVYTPAVSGTTFTMKNGVEIYGGFNATESSLSQRNLAAGFNSVLSGNNGRVIHNHHINNSAVLDGFIIKQGTSTSIGGGMRNDTSSPVIRNVVFINNSGSAGGAMANVTSSPLIYNSIFTGNTANSFFGGAIINSLSSFPVIKQAIFHNNSAAQRGGAIYESAATAAISNSIFYHNTAINAGPDAWAIGALNITYSATQSYINGAGNLMGGDPHFVFAGEPAGSDGKWFTADDGLQLTSSSNLINRGNNDSTLASAIAVDVQGNARIQNNTVDMGAYESSFLSFCDSAAINNAHVLYVNGSVNASGNGLSWQGAFRTISEALDKANYCSRFDTILVAEGSYYPTGYQGDTARGLSFEIIRGGIHVLGGYKAGSSLRNAGLYPTILSGDIAQADNTNDNSYNILHFTNTDTTTGVDGFVIKGGSAVGYDWINSHGGAIFNSATAGKESSPRISNCVFTANSAVLDGGAVYNEAPVNTVVSPVFTNCVFTDNRADGNGGAVCSYADGLVSPSFINCTFTRNSAAWEGGAVRNDLQLPSLPQFVNCLLWNNSSTGNTADQQISGFGGTAIHSLIQGGLPSGLTDGGGNISSPPAFVNDTLPKGVDDRWMTGDDGLALYTGSPAINAGLTAGAPALDITGSTRVNSPDIGAFENFCGGDVYVIRNITSCDSAWSPGYNYHWFTSGVYYDTIHSIAGCDTFFTVNLTINHSILAQQNIITCNSFTSPHSLLVWDTTGIYYDTLQTVTGCDSIIRFNLTVNHNTAAVITATACEQFTSPSGLHTWSASGIYADTIANSTGCDSIITIQLTVNHSDTAVLNVSICQGRTYFFNGMNLNATGIYRDTLVTGTGCDSIVILNLTVASTITSSYSQSVCYGGSYLFNGVNLTASGVYLDTLTATGGCDSVVTLNLIVLPQIISNISQAICNGSSYNFNGTMLSVGGTYRDTLTTVSGCDSIVELNLTVAASLSSTYSQTICFGESYQFNGANLSATGIYIDTLAAAGGCDSIVKLNLTVNALSTYSYTITICGGAVYNFNGQPLTQPGVYYDTLVNATGCDSIIILNLQTNSINDSATVSGAVCSALQANAGYQWIDCSNNQQINGATSQNFTATQNGSYACIIFKGNCTDTTNCVSVIGLGINEYPELTFLLYPNPNSGHFTIEHNYSGVPEASITDATGRNVATVKLYHQKQEIDLNWLAAGLYQLAVTTETGLKKVIKVVIE